MNTPTVVGAFIMGVLVGLIISTRTVEDSDVKDIRHTVGNVLQLFHVA